jgi:uncharacterized protein (DUF2147 family)
MKIALPIAGAGMLAASLLVAAPAYADRPPSTKEAASIAAALKAAGYVSWEEIEMDDDGPYWEIDDARKQDGTRWDLKLAPTDLSVIDSDKED